MKSPYESVEFDDTIDLKSGFPSKSSLIDSGKILKKACNDLFDFEIENEAKRLIYLKTEDDHDMLDILAKFLTEQYQDNVSASNLLFTGGASPGFIYIWTHFLPRDRKIIVAAPTYQLLLNSLNFDLKYTVESVPENSDGLNLDLVEKILQKEYELHKSEKEFCCGIYIVPTFSNPTGLLYSEDFATRMTHLAKQYNCLVVCDDVYNLLYCSEKSPKRLLAYETSETQGHIISNASFSKYFCPAIRLGWIEAHSPLIERIKNWGLLQSCNCLSQLSAMITTTAIAKGEVSRHLTNERQNIKNRLETAKSVLKHHLKNNITVSPSMGGYFIWITFPVHFPLAELLHHCSEKHILVLPGNIHSNIGDKKTIRISIARVENLAKLKEGLEKICEIINKLNV